MKYLIIVCLLFSFNAYAKCPLDKVEYINQLEQKLNKCTIDYSNKEWRTSEILNAYSNAIDCTKLVAYELFDKYYMHYNKEVKENFDDYVRVVKDINDNLVHRSDWGRVNQLSESYVLQSIGGTYAMTKNIVKEYIDEIRMECVDMYEED
jgi:hypothetical protein